MMQIFLIAFILGHNKDSVNFANQKQYRIYSLTSAPERKK